MIPAIIGIAIALYVLASCFRKRTYISFETVICAAHLSFVFPAIFIASISQSQYALLIRKNPNFDLVSLIALLCFLAGLYGYRSIGRPLNTIHLRLHGAAANTSKTLELKLFRSTLLIGIIGLISFIALASSTGNIFIYYGDKEFYSLELSGPIVWLITLSRLSYIASVCSLLLYTFYKRRHYLYCLLLFTALPACNALFLFRRFDLFFCAYLFCLFIYLNRLFRIRFLDSLYFIGFCFCRSL